MYALDTARRYRSSANPAPLTALFSRPTAGYLWFVVRLYLGLQWLTAGWHKLSGPMSIGWVQDGEVDGHLVHGGDKILAFWQRAAAAPPSGTVPQVGYAWYRHFLEYMADHRWNGWFTYLIAYGEFVIGLALILGAFTAVAALAGATLNFNYMLAGSASINPVLFLGGILLILAWRTAGYVGLDRWLLPLVGTPWQPGRLFQRRPANTSRAGPALVPPKRRLVPPPRHPILLHGPRQRRMG